MNQNPWYVDGLAEYERDRVRREVRQIRLEEKAMKAMQREGKPGKARAYRVSLLMGIVLAMLKWLIP
jgi:hypothetical protein